MRSLSFATLFAAVSGFAVQLAWGVSAGPVSSYILEAGSSPGGTDMGGIKTSGVVPSSKPSTGGTYSVDGYTIEFKYSDGQIARPYGFFWSGDKKKLVIGGTTYSR